MKYHRVTTRQEVIHVPQSGSQAGSDTCTSWRAVPAMISISTVVGLCCWKVLAAQFSVSSIQRTMISYSTLCVAALCAGASCYYFLSIPCSVTISFSTHCRSLADSTSAAMLCCSSRRISQWTYHILTSQGLSTWLQRPWQTSLSWMLFDTGVVND